MKTIRALNEWVIAPFVFLLVVFSSIVAYQTLYDINPPPMIYENEFAKGIINGGSINVIYHRTVISKKDLIINVSRTISCGTNNITYEFPTVEVYKRIGSTEFVGSAVLPFSKIDNNECNLATVVKYRPWFSIRDHQYETTPIKFKVIKQD